MKLLWICFFTFGCTCQRENQKLSAISAVTFDEKITQQVLERLTERSHPFGSEDQRNVADGLVSLLLTGGLVVEERSFSAVTPQRNIIEKHAKSPSPTGEAPSLTVSRSGKNILAISKDDFEKPCLVAIASHYDTKYLEGFEYLGANDSASSSAALMTIMRSLASHKWNSNPCGILGIWFDGEESVLPNWTDGEIQYPEKIKDNTYGSRHLASELFQCAPDYCLRLKGHLKPLKAMVLMDMIGSPNLEISLDSTAHPSLEKKLFMAAEFHRLTHVIGRRKDLIEDDHLAFVKLGIPAINLIDFNNLNHWHQPSDTLSEISLKSIKDAIILASSVSFLAASQP